MRAQTFIQFIFIIILIVLLQAGAFYAFSIIYDNEIENITTSLDSLTTKVDSLESKVGSFEQSLANDVDYIKVTKGQTSGSSSSGSQLDSAAIEARINQNLRKYLNK